MHFVYGIIGIVLNSKNQKKKKINSDHNNFVLFDFWFDIFGLQNRLCQHKT
jgi:hypothetical protein